MKKHTLLNLMLSLVFVLAALTVTAFAEPEKPEGNKLTVRFVTENGPVQGAEFKIYLALEDTDVPELIGDFADYSIDVGDFSSSSVNELSTTLAAYAARDNITPYATGITNVAGEVTFTNLERGVYLIAGTSLTTPDYIYYTSKPGIVRVPYFDDEGDLITDVVVDVKYEFVDVTPESVDRTVVKVWEDDDREFRPTSVKIQLLKNGEIYDEVTLDESCNWQFTWSGLAGDADWQVTEADIPKEYLVKITLDGTKFIVTNTFDSSTSGNTNSNSGDDTSDPNSTGTNPPTPSTPDDPKLPQTGQLWWPVPVMAVIGLVLLLAGIAASRLNNDEKN